MKKKVEVIEVNGRKYLGRVKDGKILNAMVTRQEVNSAANLKDYVLADNLNELSTVVLASGGAYTVTQLTDDDAKILKRLFEDMADIKDRCIGIMENRLFNEMA